MSKWGPGERFDDMAVGTPGFGGIWETLRWEVLEVEPGRSKMRWHADESSSFPAGSGWIVHGGMVATLLDTAMGQATWSLLNNNEVFLTADLHTEFYRPTLPGPVVAVGEVIHKTRRITFAKASLYDSGDTLLASARATNITIEIDREPPAEIE